MTKSKIWQAEHPLPNYPQNLALMLNENAATFASHPIYQEVRKGEYVPLSWAQFQAEVASIQRFLAEEGLQGGDRVAILSRNRQEMLELELAVMAMGAIAVPIFAGYPPARADALVHFCEPRFVVVSDQEQYHKLAAPESFQGIFHFDPIANPKSRNLVSFTRLLSSCRGSAQIRGTDLLSHTVALMMYTSGTMGKPKCVQLTHDNILSQQAALRLLWDLNPNDRFLSYLPWHHSFGGIFEKYAAIVHGAVLSLEHGFGKNIEILLDNWKKVRPTIFFSVPRIYQEITTQTIQNPAIDRLIFHPELRFIFTAAAPLPKSISDLFVKRGIPVIEGWGLTETSPCCTLTDPEVTRKPGVVGKPIPGVTLKLTDEGEILVKGPNVMKGYFKNPEATQKVFSQDGWFYTGDLGEFTETGLRLISRKDRVFKLSNGERVIPTEIENLITRDCVYLVHAYVAGSGRDHPVALLFPNRSMFSQMPDESRLKEGCHCPKSLADLAHCLNYCLGRLNESFFTKYYRLHAAMLVDHELAIENEELTPSMKLAPHVIGRVFKANIEHLYGSGKPLSGKVYIIKLA